MNESISEQARAHGRQGIDESPPGIRGPSVFALLRERSAYGGFDNLYCAGELVEVYQKWAARAVGTQTRSMPSSAHEHCIMMILTKISRIATGAYHDDNYKDIQGYAELAHQLPRQDKRA